MQRRPSLRLQDLTTLQGKSRPEIMDEIGANAAARDLTPEILDSLLNDEELARRYEYKCGRHRRSAPRLYGAASVRRGSSG